MRLLIVIVLVMSVVGCGTMTYVPNGLHIGAGGGGGYIDIESDVENHCIAEFPATLPQEKKTDFAFIRALEACYNKGYRYFELVSISGARLITQNQFVYIDTVEPVVEIAGFVKPTQKSTPIKEYGEKLKDKYGLQVPVFGKTN